MKTSAEKQKEARLRRVLWKYGYTLVKQRGEDGYIIADIATHSCVAGGDFPYSLTLNEVAVWMAERIADHQ